ncbi:tRNA preQ1(34) S-adenosylmethionine ribosyltransferase-isomerase QueA [bacterium]|jgi:S-adenosylmethionine:tRNA ribosyltransferase-isomerase|nr:tRNA preQ1(34) S-adenosylmethionine ribosyltransferase-isomerase QueA [bacterium]
MKTDLFNYHLPDSSIAQTPTDCRTESRLMGLFPPYSNPTHTTFNQILDTLTPNDFLVFNDTKVINARLIGKRKTGGKTEVFLEEPLSNNLWLAMMKPAGRMHVDDIIEISPECSIRVVQKNTRGGLHTVEILGNGPIDQLIEDNGTVPLPPYIKSDSPESWAERYQTIYANHPGAVAAPTAGLHFTQDLMDQIKEKGVQTAAVTLHVGLGTFKPVGDIDLENHVMHDERYIISEETAQRLNQAKKEKKNIIAVGTTVVRSLESNFKDGAFHSGAFRTQIFIKPGYQFNAINGLITNFHLPKSTLLILVSAFVGRDIILSAYQEAVEKGYRFFSFGDAMIIKK